MPTKSNPELPQNQRKPQRLKLTTRHLCERYGIVSRTVDRWTEARILPEPLRINRYRYWDLDEVEQREREGMSPRPKSESAA
jgi:hypothetical protein